MKDTLTTRSIHCCGCGSKVNARLTDGKEIYPHRKDLYALPFWKCDACGNFVGCHHKTRNRTRPLGCIPSPAVKNARIRIHGILDPLWKRGAIDRRKLYALISEKTGREYHTANIRSVEEAEQVIGIIQEISREIGAEA